MEKRERRLRRKKGIRKKIYGTLEKPRVTVYKSRRHIYVQAIDDDAGNTLSSSSDFAAEIKKNVEGAFVLGNKLAEKLKEKNIKQVTFDRNGYVYHGIVKAIAEGLRKGGVKV